MLLIKNHYEFGNLIMQDDKNIILIDFYADWCKPCNLLTPTLNNYEKDYNNISFIKIDIENTECSEIVDLYNITVLPTIIILKNKVEQTDFRIEGFNENLLKNNLKKLI